MTLKTWLQHAFAVNGEPSELSENQLRIVRQLSEEVARRGLTLPAITFLEMSRHLNYLASQTLQFFEPMVTALFEAHDYQEFAKFLERRDSIEILCEQINQAEQDRSNRQAAHKASDR